MPRVRRRFRTLTVEAEADAADKEEPPWTPVDAALSWMSTVSAGFSLEGEFPPASLRHAQELALVVAGPQLCWLLRRHAPLPWLGVPLERLLSVVCCLYPLVRYFIGWRLWKPLVTGFLWRLGLALPLYGSRYLRADDIADRILMDYMGEEAAYQL